MGQEFSLREMQPADSEAVSALNTDFDGEITTHFMMDAYTGITGGTELCTVGVVVEAAGAQGLVGMGTVRFSTVQFNGQVHPLAFLDNLKVRAEYRRQGLGLQIASWRIQRARAELGEDCIIATGMLGTNLASRGVAKKWGAEFVEPVLTLIMPARTRPPRSTHKIAARPIEAAEYEEFAAQQNAYYQDYNLYPQASPENLAAKLAVAPQGKKPYQIYVAVDGGGNLLAGATTWFRGAIKNDTLNQVPPPLKIANRLFHLLPPDFIIRDVIISGLWFVPGQIKAAQFLVESIRWDFKPQSAVIAAGFDPRDPTQAAFLLKPWHQPRPKITLAIRGPAPVERERLVFAPGRV